MGVSVKLYRVAKANKIEEVGNLEKELENAEESKLDLYKIYYDLSIIFRNKVEPDDEENLIENKVIYGNRMYLLIGQYQCGGFIPSGEIAKINEWISMRKIETAEGFAKLYDNLSEEVKQTLIDYGSPSKNELFQAYIEKLVSFYRAAETNENAVVVCAG